MKHYLNAFRHYADFAGRASRTEYWMFVLINFIITLCLNVALQSGGPGSAASMLYMLYLLATFLPSLAIMVRRLQDAGKSGWNVLLAFIPLFGWVWLIALLVKDSVSEDMEAEIADSVPVPLNEAYKLASLQDLRCPHCGGESFTFIGKDGAMTNAIGTQLLFGAVGQLITASNAKKDLAVHPLKYKCHSCKKSFLAKPGQAQETELLSEPCLIHLKRMSHLAGAVLPFFAYLNGVKIGPVKNGKIISFTTYVRHNTVSVTDHHGVALKGAVRFEATPGAVVLIRRYRSKVEHSLQAKPASRPAPVSMKAAPPSLSSPAPLSVEPHFRPYNGGGICDVCNQGLYDRKAYIVPNHVFYSSQQWRSHFKQMTARMGAPITDTKINMMRDSDHSPGSAVCQQCIHLFE